MTRRTTIAVALDGAGWHPAAWRDASARPAELFTAGYWIDLARTAERAGIDFLTIEDALGVQSSTFGTSGRPHRPGARPARRPAHRVAHRADDEPHRAGAHGHDDPHRAVPRRDRPADARLREPRSRRLAGAGLGSGARGAPLRSPQPSSARHRGRAPRRLRARPRAVRRGPRRVEVVRRLWDSWEDDAIIRDAATARFVDRDKLHYADFEGDALLGEGHLDHAAIAAGPAARHRTRAPDDPVRARRDERRPRLRHAARRRAGARRSSARCATPSPASVARAVRSRCSPTSSCCSRRRPRWPPPRSNASTPSTARPRHPTP